MSPPKTLKPEPGAVPELPPAPDDRELGPGEQLPNAEREHCALVLAEQVWAGDPSPEPVLDELRSASSPGCTRAVVDAIVGDDEGRRQLAIEVLAARRGTLLQQVVGRLASADDDEAASRLVHALETISDGAGHGNDATAWQTWAESDGE